MTSVVAAWPSVSLSEVLSQYAEYIETPESRMYPKLSVKLYGKGVVLDVPADGASLKMQHHQLAKAGQVILSEIWGKKGAIGVVPPEGEGALCTSHFFLFDVRYERVDLRWLQAIFRANYLQEQLDSEARGTTGYAAVRPKHLLAASIPLPPPDEQRRIVARIDELAARIEAAKGLRRNAAAVAEQLLAAACDAQFHRLCAAGFPMTTVAEHEELVTSGPRNFASRYVESGMRFYRAQDLTRKGDIADDGAVYVEVPPGTTTRAIVNSGDILIVITGATIGRAAVVRKRHPVGLVSQHVGLVRVNRDLIESRYLHYCILAPSFAGRQLHEAKYGQGKPGLNLTNLRSLRFPLASMSEQQIVVNHLDVVKAEQDRLLCLQRETSAELDALLPSVLDKAFRGEL